MPRTAPVPNMIAIPGMNPGMWVMAGGGGSGDGSGDGSGSGDAQGAGGQNGGNNAHGGGNAAASCGQGTTSCPGPHGGGGTSAGHPVDVATGAVYTIPKLDLFLAGPLPFELYREYRSSAFDRDVGLGWGWTHSFAFTLEVRRRTLTLWKADGQKAEVDIPPVGGVVSLHDGWLLSRDEEGYRLVDSAGLVRVFSEVQRVGPVYRLTAVVDRNLNQIGLVYDGARLASLLDSAGRMVRVRYDAGRIAAFEVKNSPSQGQWVSFHGYEYDARGDLVRVTDAEGNVTTFAYERHLLVEEQRPGGMRATFRYDEAGRCVETFCDLRGGADPSLAEDVPALLADGKTKAKGFLHCVIDYGDGGYAEIVDSCQVRRLEANGFGKVKQGTVGAAVFSHGYDEHGHETTFTDPLGAVTRTVRDGDGRVLASIDPLGRTTSYSYDDEGELSATTKPNGYTTRFLNDARGNLLDAFDDLGPMLRFAYDHRGLCERITFPNGGVARFTYDAQGNRTEVVEPDGAAKKISYDHLGRPVRFLDARNLETRYTWDRRGLLSSMTLPNGATVRYQYDADQRLTRFTNAGGQSYDYLWAGNDVVVEVREPSGPVVRARYDREGRLTRVLDEKGNAHVMVRNAGGLIVEERTFDGRTLRYAHDLAGRLTAVEGPTGTTEIAYDLAGQLVKKTFADDEAISYAYDEMGNVVEARSADAVVTFEYDLRGRRIKEGLEAAGKSFSLDSAYDPMNARVERKSSLGFDERIARDVRSRPVRVRLGGADEIASVFDAAGKELMRYLPGGAVIQSSYDAMGDIDRKSVMVAGASPAPGMPAGQPQVTVDKAFRKDPMGDIVEEYDRVFGQLRYELDAIGQLTALIRQSGLPERFTYDEEQNLFEATPGSARREYAPGGKCTRARGSTYHYDDEARLVEKRTPRAGGGEDVWRYTWSARGMLRSVERPDGVVVELGYDGFERRVTKTVRPAPGEEPRSSTWFFWDHIQLLHEVTEKAGGDREKRDPIVEERTYAFSHENREPVGHRDVRREAGAETPSDWVYYVTSPVDVPEHLVSRSGARLASLEMSAYGEARWTEGSVVTSPLRFRGQYADEETGLHYNHERYYDPALGRYISADPIGLEGDLRAFAYVGNRPRTYTDPFGLANPVRTTITTTDGSRVTGYSKGYHTARDEDGTYSGGGGTLPASFPDLNHGRGTLPNQCGECEALNKYFEGLNPDNPAHHEEIRERAREIQKITARRMADGRDLAPCRYCTQRLARLSEVSGVNLFNKMTPPSSGGTPFRNIKNPAQQKEVAQKAKGNYPYSVEQPGNVIRRSDGSVVKGLE